MEKNQLAKKVFSFLRIMIAAYIITGVLLLGLAFILYKWEVSETLMTVGTLVIYILSCAFAGFFIGKSGRQRAFAWGLLAGSTYYLILLAIALLVPNNENASAATIGLNLFICATSGMMGAIFFRK